MVKLLKCEMKKIKVKTYIISGGILILLLCFFMFVAMDSAKQGLEKPVMTYSAITKAISTFTIDAFIVYGAVLTAKLIIEEYTTKTILIMFSYPVKRENMIIAKILLIDIFLTVGVIISDFICTTAVTFLDRKFDLLAGSFMAEDFFNIVTFTIIGILMTTIFSLLPYAIGIWKKSVSSTIVSAILTAFIVQVIMSQSTAVWQVLAGMFISSVFIVFAANYISKRYVKNLECL